MKTRATSQRRQGRLFEADGFELAQPTLRGGLAGNLRLGGERRMSATPGEELPPLVVVPVNLIQHLLKDFCLTHLDTSSLEYALAVFPNSAGLVRDF